MSPPPLGGVLRVQRRLLWVGFGCHHGAVWEDIIGCARRRCAWFSASHPADRHLDPSIRGNTSSSKRRKRILLAARSVLSGGEGGGRSVAPEAKPPRSQTCGLWVGLQKIHDSQCVSSPAVVGFRGTQNACVPHTIELVLQKGYDIPGAEVLLGPQNTCFTYLGDNQS